MLAAYEWRVYSARNVSVLQSGQNQLNLVGSLVEQRAVGGKETLWC